MSLDQETTKWLHLLRGSPRFVLKDKPDGGAQVTSPEMVPARDGFYWVFGRTTLRSGRGLDSVFHLDTDSGGELNEVYWLIGDSWYDYRDPKAREILGSDEEVFPFDWSYSVPLEEDAYHD